MYLRRRCILFMNGLYNAKCRTCKKTTSLDNLISADPRNSTYTMFGPQTLRKNVDCLNQSKAMKNIIRKYNEKYNKIDKNNKID